MQVVVFLLSLVADVFVCGQTKLLLRFPPTCLQFLVVDAVSSFAFCLFFNSFHGLLAGAETFGRLRKATCSFSIVESQHEQIFQSWQ